MLCHEHLNLNLVCHQKYTPESRRVLYFEYFINLLSLEKVLLSRAMWALVVRSGYQKETPFLSIVGLSRHGFRLGLSL